MMAVVRMIFIVHGTVPWGLGRKCNASRHLRAGLSHDAPSELDHSSSRWRCDTCNIFKDPKPARAAGRARLQQLNHRFPQADRPRERESLPCLVGNYVPRVLRGWEPPPEGGIPLLSARRLDIRYRGGQKSRRRVESDLP